LQKINKAHPIRVIVILSEHRPPWRDSYKGVVRALTSNAPEIFLKQQEAKLRGTPSFQQQLRALHLQILHICKNLSRVTLSLFAQTSNTLLYLSQPNILAKV